MKLIKNKFYITGDFNTVQSIHIHNKMFAGRLQKINKIKLHDRLINLSLYVEEHAYNNFTLFKKFKRQTIKE